jgi:manganese/zinc/iron transport system ATP- binding protein
MSAPATTAVPILDVHDVSVAYQHKTVLWDVDLTVKEPHLVGIIGPNGAGKSTLLKAILGLVPIANGTITILGKPLSQQRKLIGYVPQRESVDWDFPISVLDTVVLGTYGRLGWFRRPGKTERGLARDCLQQVGLEEFAKRQIGQLSGGQQQRVFLARALAQQAQIYFMDEPMAGVDAVTERVIFDLLHKLRESGKTVFVVHHDLRTVREYFDYGVLLNGMLVASGPADQVFTPEKLQAAYKGRLSILDAAAEAVRTREAAHDHL